MLLARIRGWKKPKSPFNGSSHLVLEANQEGRGAVGCPDPLKLCSSAAICKAGPILMGLRGGFWWLLGGWGGGPGGSGVGVSGENDATSHGGRKAGDSQGLGTLLGPSQPCPHHSQQLIWGLHPPSGPPRSMVSLGGAQGGGTVMASDIFPLRPHADQQPKPPPTLTPNPNPGAGRRVPTQYGGMQLAQHPWVLPPWVLPVVGDNPAGRRDLRGHRSCPGRGGGRSAGSPPGSHPVPGRRGRAAAGPRAQPSWRHRQQLRRRREKTHQAGTAPALPSTEPAPKCARSQPVLPPTPLPRPRHTCSQSPCQNYPLGKGARLPPHVQNRSGVSRLHFFQAISWHKSQPGLILAGGRGGAARPRLSPEQDAPYPSITGAG